MTRDEQVVDGEECYDCAENHDRPRSQQAMVNTHNDFDGSGYRLPVHGCPSWIRLTWKELEDPRDEEERNCNDIDTIACFAKSKPRRREGFTPKALLEDTCPFIKKIVWSMPFSVAYMLCRSYSCSKGRN